MQNLYIFPLFVYLQMKYPNEQKHTIATSIANETIVIERNYRNYSYITL